MQYKISNEQIKKTFGTENFGIQKFSNSEEAWDMMSGDWGEQACDSEKNLKILTDDSFKREVLIRAVEKAHEYLVDKSITKEKYMDSLLLSNNNTDYLLDFNFFYYSNKNCVYYTSRMDFKDDYNHLWGPHQWNIFYELMNLVNIDSLVQKAISLVEKYQDLDIIINDYIYNEDNSNL